MVVVLLKRRRIQWRMTNDFSHLSRVGKRTSCDGLIYSSHCQNLEGIAGKKKLKVCGGRPHLNKGNMLAVKRPQNSTTRITDVSGELRNRKRLLSHSRRTLRPLLNAIRSLEFRNPDGDSGALQFSDKYHRYAWNLTNSFALSHSRNSDHTVGAYRSKQGMHAFVTEDWEIFAMTCDGYARENQWSKVLRQCDYNDIINTLNLHPRRILEPSAHSASEFVKTSKVAAQQRKGFPMPARKHKPFFSLTSMRGTKMPSSLRKRKSWRCSNGRLRSGPQTLSRIGARSSAKAAGVKQLSPLLLRRSQIKIRWHLPEGKRSARVLPASVLHVDYRTTPWLAKREKAAIVLQAQWRMCLARRDYQRLQHATRTIQRQWQGTKGRLSRSKIPLESGVNGVDILKSRFCSDTSDSAVATQHTELPGLDGQRNLKMSAERLYDTYISAIQEDEIFDEFLSFLPCPELSSGNVLSVPKRPGSGPILQSNALLLEERPNPESPESFSPVQLVEADDIFLRSPKTWTYDICSMDSPSCSPAKELTFARISIDGSLPPTPIKEWSSRKRDPVKRALPDVWDPTDIVELHQSPTKDWASPHTKVLKPPLILVGPTDGELKSELFQLPSEWFMDLDELDIPESCWDTSKVTSIAFSPPSDSQSKSLRGFCADIVSSSRALICVPEEVSPAHCAVIEDLAGAETVQFSRRREITFSPENVDGFGVSPSADDLPTKADDLPTKADDSRPGSPLSPALEEELLDELTKLFQDMPDPSFGPSLSSSLPASPPGTVKDFRRSESLRASHPKALSRVCNGVLSRDGFSTNSARKLNFNLEDEAKLKESEGHQDDGEDQMPTERMEVGDKKSLSSLSDVPSFALPGPDEILEGDGQKHLGMLQELDYIKSSRDSRSYSQRCQSTVTDFLQLVEQDFSPGAVRFGFSPGSPSMLQTRESQLPTSEDEADFCDKAVDGNVVAVKDTSYEGRELVPDPFHAWEAASATETPTDTPVKCGALDVYDSRKASIFGTSKIQRSNTTITRSCGAINKTKPPLPIKSRRISFDQINYNANEPCTPADEKIPLLPDKKVREKLLHTSPVSPDTPLASCAGYQETSSALSVSKKYFLQSPSSRLLSRKCDSDTESVVSPASSHSAKLESSLEGDEKKPSAKHARALFSCQESALPEDAVMKSASLPSWNEATHFSCFEDNYEAMLKHRDTHRLWFPDNLSGPLLLTSGAESDCSFRKSTSSAWDCGLMTLMMDGGFPNAEDSSPSLYDLCKVWEEESMDLVTRSLKYKSLMTDPELLRQELKVAFEKNEPSSPQNVAWEIQNIERLKEKLESRERLKELIKQQRDTIYINIATNASMRERYRLYSKWGIRRMSRARLRKVIYELLWKDPKRFHASADLVLQYL